VIRIFLPVLRGSKYLQKGRTALSVRWGWSTVYW